MTKIKSWLDYQFYDAFGKGCGSINPILPGERVNLNPPVRLLIIKFEFLNIYFAENFWNLILVYRIILQKSVTLNTRPDVLKTFFVPLIQFCAYAVPYSKKRCLPNWKINLELPCVLAVICKYKNLKMRAI